MDNKLFYWIIIIVSFLIILYNLCYLYKHAIIEEGFSLPGNVNPGDVNPDIIKDTLTNEIEKVLENDTYDTLAENENYNTAYKYICNTNSGISDPNLSNCKLLFRKIYKMFSGKNENSGDNVGDHFDQIKEDIINKIQGNDYNHENHISLCNKRDIIKAGWTRHNYNKKRKKCKKFFGKYSLLMNSVPNIYHGVDDYNNLMATVDGTGRPYEVEEEP
tara:strand:- start:255 stop:905 length:651 start_codon:yes stop_codon:yes gene_type:complete